MATCEPCVRLMVGAQRGSYPASSVFEARRQRTGFDLKAKRDPHQQVVRVGSRTQVGAAEDIIPERELGAEVRISIFTKHRDGLGELPRDTRAHLHAD